MKYSKLTILTALALGSSVVSSSAANALLTTNVIAESTVQYSTTVPTSFTNYVSGYNKVKYNITTTSCKTYFKFDFTGQNPNTNYDLHFSWTQVANNGPEHCQLWVLNQSYSAFVGAGGSYGACANPSLSWSGAQANDTSAVNNDMLTSGPFTADLVNDVNDPGASSGAFGGTLPAPWGKYLINNQVVIVLSVTNDPVDSSNGGRLATNATVATFQPLTAGTAPPTITSIASQTVRSTISSAAIPFTVSDPQDAASSLNNITVSLGNTNVTLLSTNIANLGGGSRTLTFTPTNNLAPGTTANVTVTVIVTDSAGNSATTSFQLTVLPFVSLPVLYSATTNVNSFPPTNMLLSAGSITIPFSVVDTNITTSSQLAVTAAASTYSANLNTPSVALTSSSAHTNGYTVTVPVTAKGVGIVNLSLGDSVNLVTQNVSLAVMVLPNSSYAVCDTMTYQPSTSYSAASGHKSLASASAGLWNNRSFSGSVDVITTITPSGYGVPVGVPVIRGSTSGNSFQLRFANAPYQASHHYVIYACIQAQWADISPSGGNQYFVTNSTGPFFELAADSSASGTAMAEVCSVFDVSGSMAYDSGNSFPFPTNGLFQLALYNGTNNPPVINTGGTYSGGGNGYNANADIVPNFAYSGILPQGADYVEMSYDVDTGISKLWVGGTSSSDSSGVSLQDQPVTNLVNVGYLVLRQNGGMGNILVESASVLVQRKVGPIFTSSTPGITRSGNTVTLTFTDKAGEQANEQVWSASAVDGPYTQVSGGNLNWSPEVDSGPTGTYTVTVSNQTADTKFYKIVDTDSSGLATVAFPF